MEGGTPAREGSNSLAKKMAGTFRNHDRSINPSTLPLLQEGQPIHRFVPQERTAEQEETPLHGEGYVITGGSRRHVEMRNVTAMRNVFYSFHPFLGSSARSLWSRKNRPVRGVFTTAWCGGRTTPLEGRSKKKLVKIVHCLPLCTDRSYVFDGRPAQQFLRDRQKTKEVNHRIWTKSPREHPQRKQFSGSIPRFQSKTFSSKMGSMIPP